MFIMWLNPENFLLTGLLLLLVFVLYIFLFLTSCLVLIFITREDIFKHENSQNKRFKYAFKTDKYASKTCKIKIFLCKSLVVHTGTQVNL